MITRIFAFGLFAYAMFALGSGRNSSPHATRSGRSYDLEERYLISCLWKGDEVAYEKHQIAMRNMSIAEQLKHMYGETDSDSSTAAVDTMSSATHGVVH